MLFENMCQGCVGSSLHQLGCIVAILRFKFLQHNNSSSSTPSILFYRSAAPLQLQQGEILIVRLQPCRVRHSSFAGRKVQVATC